MKTLHSTNDRNKKKTTNDTKKAVALPKMFDIVKIFVG